MKEITKRPAIYARVSTEEQAASGTSLRTQIESLRADLAKEGHDFPLIFVDDGYSGAVAHRPQLMALEAAISEGEVSEVRVTSLDRLSRDLVLQETLISRWMKLGVGFVSQREPDLGENDPTRILIRQVLGAISQYERSVIAARMLAGRIARAHQGHWPRGKPAFGYVLEGQPARAVLDPEKAKIIREAGQRIIAGERAAHIAEDFVRRGIEGPGGKSWESSYLSRMLRNPIYRGEARYRVREFVEPNTRRKAEHAANGTKNRAQLRPEDEWFTFEVPAVFTDAEWAELQTQLGKRGMPKKESAAYLLSRRFSSACGSAYHGNRANGKPRYLCSRRTNRGRTGAEDCVCPQVSAGLIDDAIWAAIAEILIEPERIEKLARDQVRLLRAREATNITDVDSSLTKLDRKIVKLRDAINRLISFHAESETLNEEDFQRAFEDMKNRLQNLELERHQLLLGSAKPRPATHDRKLIAKVASEVTERLQNLTFKEKQRVIALLDVQVRVDEDGRLIGSLSAPQPLEQGSQRKVANRTSSRFRRRTSR